MLIVKALCYNIFDIEFPKHNASRSFLRGKSELKLSSILVPNFVYPLH